MNRVRSLIFFFVAAVLLSLVAVQSGQAAGGRDGAAAAPLAISGYDPTVFFSRGTAARGKAQHAVEYEGATYHFLTESNKKEFAHSPFRYLPQYAGNGAYGIFLGEVVKPNPRLWSIDGGRLYLFSTRDRRDAWLRGIESHRRRADKNWPSIEIGLARAKQQAEEDAARSAAAESQGCEQVFRENYASPSRHELIVNGCTPAANSGNATASLLLGRVYAEQYSPLKNYTKAAKLLKFAADEGNEVARWRLGDLYAEGNGVPRDLETAFNLFERSAENGQSPAMYRLARSYHTGKGVEVDLVKAWAWYNVAANRSEGAARQRDKLEQDMSAEELERAQLATLAFLSRIRFNGKRI